MKKEGLQQLLSEMSLREKIGQMIQITGACFDEEAVLTGETGKEQLPEEAVWLAGSVLGMIGADKIRKLQETYMKRHPHHIPLVFMADVIHGCRTIFPIPLAQACSFHPQLVREAAAAAAAEASSEGIRASFSPMTDVSKDARWGRIMESFGEDPYVNGVMGTAMLEGYQEDRSGKQTQIAGCLKHFAGYGAVSAGREYNDVEISQRTFLEQYLKPFRMAVKAKPAMVMTAFTAADRKPVSADGHLLGDILRGQLGFEGTVISDWGSVGQLEEQRTAENQKEAARLAVTAGVDIDMMSPAYVFWLEKLVQEGTVSMEQIDTCVWRILEMKNRLGLFEHPYAGIGKSRILSEESAHTAFELACESCVLLKNQDILPLDKNRKTLWAGPYVNSPELLSRWAIFGRHSDVTAIRDELKKSGADAECLQGCGMLSKEECRMWQVQETPEITQGVRLEDISKIGRGDTVVLVLGEHESQSGEAASRAFLELPVRQMQLFEMAAERTENLITVIITGRPLDLRRITEKSRAVLLAWRPGTMGARAIVSLLYGSKNPSGKLAACMPYCVGQEPVSYWDMTTGHVMSQKEIHNRYRSRYMDIPNEPLYSFGYGMSYTQFEISSPSAWREGERQDGNVSVCCRVKNTGQKAGAEVVQCYVRTLCARIVRPAKELIRFEKVFLEPGGETEVRFSISPEEFMYYDENMQLTNQNTPFEILVGNSSACVQPAGRLIF